VSSSRGSTVDAAAVEVGSSNSTGKRLWLKKAT